MKTNLSTPRPEDGEEGLQALMLVFSHSLWKTLQKSRGSPPACKENRLEQISTLQAVKDTALEEGNVL